MLYLEAGKGGAVFSSLNDVKSALMLLGYDVDLKKVENDLLQNGRFQTDIEHGDIFDTVTIQYQN